MRTLAAAAVCAGLAAAPAHAGAGVGDPRSTIRIIEQRGSLAARETGQAIVELVNGGPRSWSAGGPVRLSYRWLDAKGRPVAHDARETVLPSDVPAGSMLRVCAPLVAPTVAGRYAIKWDLIGEGAAWLSERGLVVPAFELVDVSDPARPDAASTGPVLAWLLVTLLHGAAAAWVAWRLAGRPQPPSIEETLFTALLVAIGGLVAVLAVVAASVGLSLAKASVALCVADISLLLSLRAASTGSAGQSADTAAAPDPWERAAEWAGAVVITAVALHWVAAAAAVSRVTGVDAAHYHVPLAVNFALGTSPLGLLATPHLYPANTSLLAAWFLLPFGDPLIVDLAVLPGFLLLFASLAWIFRVATGRSGLAWMPWFVLLLFSTPLWRMSSLMSADLAYAAGFVALFAQLFATRVRDHMSRLDLARAAIACGLLIGSKITGLSSAAFLLALFVLSSLFRPVSFSGVAVSRTARIGLLAAAVVLATLTGGFWLARNWINYGSPVAPMGVHVLGRTVFPGPGISDPSFDRSSAGGDLRRQPHRALSVVETFLRKWLGAFFAPSLLGLLIVPLELLVVRSRAGPAGQRTSARVVLWGGVIAVSGLVLWWTAALPWTSLTGTEGMSLRFVLPILALLPLASMVCWFSPVLPWHARTITRSLVLALFIVVSLGVLLHGQATAWSGDVEGRPGLDARSLTLAAALISGPLAAAAVLGRRIAMGVAVAIVVGLAPAGGRMLAARDWSTRSDDRAELNRLETCFAAGLHVDANQARRLFLAARWAESSVNADCDRRRFFVGTWFPEPLTLQPVPYGSLVFDARRPGVDFFGGGEQLTRGAQFVEAALAEAKLGGRPGVCDYVVVGTNAPDGLPRSAVLARLRAQGRLRQVGEVGPYLLYAAGR